MDKIIFGDCVDVLRTKELPMFDLTFLDPPFNQGKNYRNHNDNMVNSAYWEWMSLVCGLVYENTNDGGAMYFMQREKNTHHVFNILLESGWSYQNLIIWKKKASAVPQKCRFGKAFQTIVFMTKGKKVRVFNRLRIDPPLYKHEKYKRPNGMFVTDVWDDIRELTSGYFAGEEPLRDDDGKRFHHQQSPIRLLTRIILASTLPGDMIFDPFAGTGTTAVVANQLHRNSISIDNDKKNIVVANHRLLEIRECDCLESIRNDYLCTENLGEIWT